VQLDGEGNLLVSRTSSEPVYHELTLRVAYSETDGQRRVHHAVYLNYFEQGRVELLRSLGMSYKDFEQSGLLLVVSEMQVRYFLPAEFDDVLTLRTTVESARGARIRHAYRLTRGDSLIVSAESTIACIDTTGRVRRLPAELLETRPS
jgi:acyl-CoA thioester hydrolase